MRRALGAALSCLTALPALGDEACGALVRRRGDGSPEVRDRAQAELETLGLGAVSDLERALAAPEFEDPVIRARLGVLLARARRAGACNADPLPLAAEALAGEIGLFCKGAELAVRDEVTDEPFRRLVDGEEIFRDECRSCLETGKSPQPGAVLLLPKSGPRALVHRGHVSRLVAAAGQVQPALTAEAPRETAAALVALGRHAGSARVHEGALKTARAEERRAGGFKVSLKNLGDAVILQFDEKGRLVAAMREDG
jgi:hypothetical protein